MSQIQRLEQKRAAEAWSCVDFVDKDLDPAEVKDIQKFKKEYRSNVMKLPSLILTNGLGQTLAFLKSKGKREEGKSKKAEEQIYEHLQEWLTNGGVINWSNATKGELIERIMAVNSDKYRHVTSETLAFMNWLKRFADAVLPKDGGE